MPVRLDLPAGRTTWLRIELTPDSASTAPAGLAEVGVRGLAVRQTVHPEASAAGVSLLSRAADARRACILDGPGGWTCAEALARPGEEAAGLDRALDLRAPEPLRAATVVALPGRALDRLLDQAVGRTVSSSSTAMDDPAARPGAAFDGDPATGWIAEAGDRVPTLRLTLAAPLTVRSLALQTDEVSSSRVRAVLVSTESGRAEVPVRGGRLARFAPLTGRHWTFVLRVGPAGGGDPTPLRVDELTLPGLATAPATLDIGCDAGPGVDVGGTPVRLRVRTTTDAVVRGGPLAAQPCGPVTAAPGAVRVRGIDAAEFGVDSLRFGDLPAPLPGPAVSAGDTSPEHRTWVVGPGPAAALVLGEGANAGWQALVDGASATSMRVDGWRQAWLLPASDQPRTVVADFVPGRWHRAGLLIGALLVVVLVGLAAAPARRAAPAPVGPAAARRPEPAVAALAVPGLLAGVAGLVAGVVVLGVHRRWPRTSLGLLLASGGVAAGLAAATGSTWGTSGTDAAVQVLAAAVVASLAVLLLGGSAPARADSVQEGPLDAGGRTPWRPRPSRRR